MEAIAKAKALKKPEVQQVVEDSTILQLRQRAIDKSESAEAASMELPHWPRGVTQESAEVGDMLSKFLVANNQILSAGCMVYKQMLRTYKSNLRLQAMHE